MIEPDEYLFNKVIDILFILSTIGVIGLGIGYFAAWFNNWNKWKPRF